MLSGISIILALVYFNQSNQSDMTSRNECRSIENDKPLKVMVNLPDEISIGQPCEIKVDIKNISGSSVLVNKRLSVGYQNSLSRELYISICEKGSSTDIGKQKVLYERQFSPSSDFVWLLPEQQISTKFNLLDWYEIPSAGIYTIQVFYQADEKLAYKPDGLCGGTFCSEEKILTVKSE